MLNFWKINKEKLILLLIILAGAFLRLYGLNWDQGHHLHPDERAIIMFALPLDFPENLSEFLSPESPLNPQFFAYGNLPLYLLKIVGSLLSNFDSSYLFYDKINLVGRAISAIADMGTLILLFFLAKKIFNKTVGLISSFFYAVSVFPIQASHFYAVDILLTFFVLLTLYMLIRFYEKPSLGNSIGVGIFFAASLATKISAIPLIGAITTALAIDFLLIVAKQPHKPYIWLPHIPRFLRRLMIDGLAILVTTIIAFVIFQPYSIIDFNTFLKQNMEQSQMTRDAFTFPYTLQYVGKIPYFYELKNIFFWGQGPILAMLSLMGTLYFIFRIVRKHLGWWRGNDLDSSEVDKKWAQELILIIFFLSYFAVVGKFAVGWMRYMLPLYPLLCLFAAIISYKLLMTLKEKFRYWKLVVFVCIGSILVWPLSFMHIYTKPNTRVLASEWINQNIPLGATITTEHWDDGLPIGTQSNYRVLELPLYDPDTPTKWDGIDQTLEQASYIIISSNRLYTPLTKLTDCDKLPIGKCYTQTAQYYKDLFAGKLGFEKVAEFTSYPKFSFPLVKWKHEINDSAADESFTVYDHPRVMIFKKDGKVY